MQEIWLFGDSYAQEARTVFESTKDAINYEFVTWPNKLKNKYNLKNFAEGGTGPTWSLKLLNDEIKKYDNLKNVNLIFFISAIWRLDLSFYHNPSDQCLTSKIPAPDKNMIKNGWDIFNLNSEELNVIKPYKKYNKFVKNLWEYYLLLDSFQHTEITKIIGNVFLYKNLFKKILVWPIFHLPNIPIKSVDNFYYVDKMLFEIERDPYGYGFDPRMNHLSEINHQIMFNQLCNWVEFEKPIDTRMFLTNTY